MCSLAYTGFFVQVYGFFHLSKEKKLFGLPVIYKRYHTFAMVLNLYFWFHRSTIIGVVKTSNYRTDNNRNPKTPPTLAFMDSEPPNIVNAKATPKIKGKRKQKGKSKPPEIPTRTSSKRGKRVAADLDSSENQDHKSSELVASKQMKWEDQRDRLNKDLEFSRKRLKPQASFTSEYVGPTS